MLKEKITEDMKVALRAKNEVTLGTLRMLVSALHNREIEKRAKSGSQELTEEEVMATIRSQVKRRKDAIGEFQKGGRDDLVKKESAELVVLEHYLPPEMPDDELLILIREARATLPSDAPQGRVMGEVMKRVLGRASGDRVKLLVEQATEYAP